MSGRTAVAIVAVATIALAACGATYDEEGADAVHEWIDDTLSAIEGTIIFVDLEDRDDRCDEAARLDEQAAWVHGDEFPGWEEIESWQYRRTLGPNTWDIDGEDLAEVVDDLEWAASALAHELCEGTDDFELALAVERADEAVADARALVTGR